jgi:hypothetical protein
LATDPAGTNRIATLGSFPHLGQLADGPGSYYQVTEGLLPGEEIVVNGSFLLKTELKKTSIGAGCCEVEPIG